MGHVEPGMVIEDLAIALSSGRCPACGSPLMVCEDNGDVELNCPGCSWCGGFGGDWL